MLRKGRVPRELEEDAAQDIRVAWALNKVRVDYEPEQVLQYAYSIALRAALHTRRAPSGRVAPHLDDAQEEILDRH